MKTKNKPNIITGALVGVLILGLPTVATTARAAELAGAKLPDTLAAGAKTLKLNGLGLRKKAMFKVYVGGLYLESPSKDAGSILVTDQAKAIRMQFLRDLTKAQLVEAFQEGFDANAQDKLLEHCISLSKFFKTDRIRCFDFWRLNDQKPYRVAINAKLHQAAERCAKDKMILLLENEMSCNTATAEESVAVLKAVPNRNFMLNWDPGNAAAIGSVPYPDGYRLLPKERIGHCHCKDVVRRPGNKYEWAPVGGGSVDWVGQLQALKNDDFHFGLSLETHWHGGGTPEASTRTSFDGLKKALGKAGISC